MMGRIFSRLLDPRGQRQILFKNSVWLAIADGLTRLVKFIVTLYVIRILGSLEYGKFAFAFAFVSLFSTLFDFGLAPVMTREFARREEEDRSFSPLLSFKLGFGMFVFVLIAASGHLVSSDGIIRRLMVVLALALWMNEASATYYALFRSRQRMEYESWMGILGGLVFGGAGFLLLSLFPSIVVLSYTYLVSAVAVLSGTVILAVWKGYPFRLAFDRLIWQRYLAMAAPLALYGVVMGIYSFSDSVMLGAFGHLEETGWYNAALRIVGLAIIPMNFVGPVFLPALSSALAKTDEGLQRLFDLQLEIMIFAAFMITCVVFSLAPTIMEVAFTSSFSAGAVALQISIFVAFFQYLWTPYNQVLIVFNQQRKVFLVHLVGAIANLLLNAMLIPVLSLYGASLASVVTQAIVFGLLFGAVSGSTPIAISLGGLSAALVPAAVSAVAVGGTLLLIGGSGLAFLSLAVLAGPIGYTLCFFALRATLIRMGLLYGVLEPRKAWNSRGIVDVVKR